MPLWFSRRKAARQSPHKSRRPAPKRRRLIFDSLEARQLLSLTTPGTPVTIDSSGTASFPYGSPDGSTGAPVVAMDSAGDAVVAWADRNSSTGTWNLMWQQYAKSANGFQAVGSTVTQAPNVTAGVLEGNIGNIMVARAPTSGDFVVVWGTSSAPTHKYPNGTYATQAQLYSSAGTPIGSTLLVGGSGSNRPESVAMNDSGFDVLYLPINNKGEFLAPTVQRYSYTSSSDSAVGKPITLSAGDTIAMDHAGDFVVVWDNVNTTTNSGQIDAQLFSSAGSSQGTIQVSPAISMTTEGLAGENVAMDSAGNFVVDWEYEGPTTGGNWELLARQFTTGGTPVQSQANPILLAGLAGDGGALAELPDGNANGNGAFDVTWSSGSTSSANVSAATYSASGTLTQSLTVTTDGDDFAAWAAVDANSDLFVVWEHLTPNVDVGNIDGEFFLDPPALAPATASPIAASPTGAASPSGSSSAATDAVFAAYAYPDDDDTLG